MDIGSKKMVVTGVAGLIGSRTVDLLSKTDFGEILVYDNFVRGRRKTFPGRWRTNVSKAMTLVAAFFRRICSKTLRPRSMGGALEEPMAEDHHFNNENFYGATKIAGNATAQAFHHRYGVGLRYINVYALDRTTEGPISRSL